MTQRSGSPSYTPLQQQDFTWNQNPSGNYYVNSVVTTLDPGSPNQKQSKTTQTQDSYGNVTQTVVYDYGSLVTPARTYTNAYLNNNLYAPRFIFDRLISTTVTD